MGRVKGVRHFLTLSLLLIFAGSAWAEVCKGNNVPKAGLAQYDAQAILCLADQDAALQTHLPYGQPVCPRLLPQFQPPAVSKGKQRTGAADAYLSAHTVSVRELETLTGIDLLPKLDGEALKRAVASEVWPRN